MATTGRIALWNLRCGIAADDLVREIIRIWPKTFTKPFEDGQLEVKVFSQKDGKQKAVVQGFLADLEELNKIAQTEKILDRRICFAADNGDERDEFGDFVVKRKRIIVRDQAVLEGRCLTNMDVVFTSRFLNELNPNVFNPLTKRVFINSSVVPLDDVVACGGIKFIGPSSTNRNFTMLRFNNALGLLQAMTSLNNNENVATPSFQFVNEFGTETSQLVMKRGIGSRAMEGASQECIIDLIGIETHYGGYIPFEYLDKDIIDLAKIDSGFASNCWRCARRNRHATYQLLGVGVDLNFIAGICACSYSGDEVEAYKWPNQVFTRLIVNSMTPRNAEGRVQLSIKHRPMLSYYNNAEMYSNIVIPILEEEWFTDSEAYRNAFKTTGTLQAALFVEETQVRIKKKKKLRDVYAIDVIVRKNNAWCMDNVMSVKKAKIEMTVIVPQARCSLKNIPSHITAPLKGRIRRMKPHGSANLLLEIQIYCEKDCIPVIGKEVKIQPKPDKLEYLRTRRFLNQWSQGKLKNHPFLDFILSPNTRRNWTLLDSSKPNEKNTNQLPIRIGALDEMLNENQITAMRNVLTSSLSFIQGPPGTGKTFTAGCIASRLAVTEEGKIFICASSNEATDRCFEVMEHMNTEFNLKIKVVRMMAKSREMSDNLPGHDSNPSNVLHNLVRRSSDWAKTPLALEICAKINRLGLHKITHEEWIEYENFVKKIEMQILSEHDVIVCTISTLADSRAEALSKFCSISTLIIDEAGQLTQPASLMATIINPSRVVMIGDHLQLQATIKSVQAKNAGLGKSELEWASSWVSSDQSIRKSYPPWTMLIRQHRMSPDIRSLVSRFSYNDKLEDAQTVLLRKSALPPSIFEILPEFRVSSILIKNVESHECKVGNTFSNPSEAKEIVGLLNRLVGCGVDPHLITVLSFYEGQKIEILNQLKRRGNRFVKDVEVKNVDAYQGKENSIVILSMVRTTSNLGFLKIPNRMNVGISRAKELLIIVCRSAAFMESNNGVIKSFYQMLTDKGRFIL